MSIRIKSRIKSLFPAETQSWLLWCLAVQAQGPVDALAVGPATSVSPTPMPKASSSCVGRRHQHRTLGIGSSFARSRAHAVGLGLAAVLALTGVSTASAAGGWSGPTSVDQPFFAQSLSCPSSSFCVAAAREAPPAVYDSGSWNFVSASSPIRHASCTSSSFCVGVGANYASVFNGTSWSTPVEVMASAGSFGLVSISCASETFCLAIDEHANAYKFNGTSWTTAGNIAGAEAGAQEFAVDCVSATFCIATDNQATSVFNGTAWTQHKVLSTGELSAVTCLSESFCVAVGTREVRFNGTSWSTPAEIDGGENITGVACESTSTCVAVDRHGQALTSNGASWSAPARIDAFDSNVFLSGYEDPSFAAVSCTSAECRAIDTQGRVFAFSVGTWTGPVVLGGSLLSVSCPTDRKSVV